MTAEIMVPAKRSAATDGFSPAIASPQDGADFDAAHQGLAHRPEDALQGLVLAHGVPVDLADHRAHERQVGDEEGLVPAGEVLEVGPQAPGRARQRRPRPAGADPELAADHGLKQVLLCPERAEERDLV